MFNNGNNNARNDKFARLKAIASGQSAPVVESSFPEIWKHEVGKPLIGIILGFSSFEHERFGLQETVIVELENGQRVSAILNNYLSNGMQIQCAEPGDLVSIRLLGKEKSTNGSVYNKFELVVQKEQ
ncbi:hypothetical protein [Methylomonas koyamae]|uniref:hypothetical protein n=1 Tax=Methylomonas koyamae TaxID=702114 RepID=UPI002872FB01|nr:hypothetical protein [Methylomonas koyamae]WNB74102.1 hypothetical protein RI210_12490 [Methylomonas koyamae]